MTEKTPDDYDTDDGWDKQRGVEQCPHCESVYSPNGGITGPVYDQRGREYEYHLDTEPGQGPFFCEDCWPELETNRKQRENKTLGDFS